MKRLRVEETAVKEVSGSPLSSSLYPSRAPPSAGPVHRQALATLPPAQHNTTPTIAYTSAGTVKVVSEGMQSSLYPPPPSVSYSAMPSATAPHSGKPQAMQPVLVSSHAQMRSKGSSPPAVPLSTAPQGPQQQSPGSFQRLKVEDALSYLDQVKFKFGQQPQVYNDFLDIMKEFKSQSIDTPGVIARVSNLFKGYPELIVGFNTFLPPGYKIEVQANESGYAFQVSVSMPSPTAPIPQQQQQKPAVMQILQGTGTIIHNNPSASLPQSQPLTLPSSHATSCVVTQSQPSVPVLHHTAGPYGPANSQHNNVSHNISLSQAQAAVSQVLAHAEAPQNQPVEFNHAINYVNKIKIRFQAQPEKYKRFLEILHTYQREQRTLKETTQAVSGGGGKHLTEAEVYSQVAKLFENQDDLLAEFGQFLPDATTHISSAPSLEHLVPVIKKQPIKPAYRDHIVEHRHAITGHKPGHVPGQVKRSPPYPNLHMHRDAPTSKKHKMSSCRDVTLAEAAKFGSLHDFAFFDKVRKALRSQEVYDNFLRCLALFNQEIVSKTELVQMAQPFLSKFPELMKWFRDFLGHGDMEVLPHNSIRNERPQDLTLEIDLTTAKRLGASYCVIPPAQEGLRCSGRTQLCKEVLNDQWVSFPTWSEDSTFVSSRKTQYEEYMYRCEDERFELDVVIETNASTIRVLEGVSKKLGRMNPEEIARYRLDDCLGGTSPVLHQRALKRIYGDKAQDIIDGLKRSPAVGVPVVLRRLKAKEEEWREAHRGFNKLWREQNEKYYLKSLDHQGINFKQNDMKALRSKSLFNEIETIFDERHEQSEDGAESMVGPHLIFPYKDRTILDDAANLLIHHVKRQTGVQKVEKRRIKHILRQFVPDLFFHPRQQLSDDEREDDDDKEDGDGESTSIDSKSLDTKIKSESPGKSPAHTPDGESIDDNKLLCDIDVKEEDVKVPLHAQSELHDEAYSLFMASNNWYLFLRLHAVLCDRLAKIYKEADKLAVEETKQKVCRKESTAVALRLKPRPQIEIEDYYPAFLDMVKNLLDGNMEASSYEDTLREMFGIHAYIAFTLDKVVSYAVRQLQHCVTERTAISCMELFQKEQKKAATGGPCATAHRRLNAELAYQRAGESIAQDENCFKIYIYKVECRMSIELLDTEPEDSKKVDDAKKWSTYKDRYAGRSVPSNDKPDVPVFLHRNMQTYPNRKYDRASNIVRRQSLRKNKDSIDDLDKAIVERPPPQRNQPEHGPFEASDETQCKFNSGSSKMLFVVNKDSYLYKKSALTRARQSHPAITRRLAGRFRTWLKRWAQTNISDSQHKTCTDWLMGRGEGLVPNRTRVLTNNDLSRSPYAPYNRYRVERLTDESS